MKAGNGSPGPNEPKRPCRRNKARVANSSARVLAQLCLAWSRWTQYFLSYILKLSCTPWAGACPAVPGSRQGLQVLQGCCQPHTCPSGGLQRASLRAGLQLHAATSGLALALGNKGMATPAWPQYLPSQGRTGCDPIPLWWEEQKGSQAANAAAQVVLGCQPSSAQLGRDSGQLANSSETTGAAERWQVRSISLFTLPSWSSATSKEGKDAKKMQLEYEYDVQTAAAAVTQLEPSSGKGPSHTAGNEDDGQPQLPNPPSSPSPPPPAPWQRPLQPLDELLPTELLPACAPIPWQPGPPSPLWHSRGC